MVSSRVAALAALAASASASTCTVSSGASCEGGDIKDIGQVASEQQCCDACSQTPGCSAWTWNKVFGKHCYLKSACIQMKGDWAKVSGFVGGPAAGPEAVAADLNRRYFGFNPNDDSSPLGVTMTLDDAFEVFCHVPCYKGFANCRMSATVYNHKIVIDKNHHNIVLGLGRSTGFVYNQALVEKSIGKCSYAWDGASFNRYNGACGCASTSSSCSSWNSAYANHCPSTGRTCSISDPEVEHCSCDYRGMPSSVDSYRCFFKGAAYDTHRQSDSNDQLRNMIKFRMAHQDGPHRSNDEPKSYWNEVVLDEYLMLPFLKQDGASVVEAFVYRRGDSRARGLIRRIRDEFERQFKPSTTIPIIAVDTAADTSRTKAIFFAEDGDEDYERSDAGLDQDVFQAYLAKYNVSMDGDYIDEDYVV